MHDVIDIGRNVYSLIYQLCHDESLTQDLLQELDLLHLRRHGFRQLSTGETRRVMLGRALAIEPELLIIDNIFNGLDVEHRQSLIRYLTKLSVREKSPIQMLVIFSREEDMPEWIDNVALFNQGEFKGVMNKTTWEQHPLISQIKAQSIQQSEQMIALIRRHQYHTEFDDPVFEIKQGQVNYLDNIIFTGINWRIDNGQHWQIQGPYITRSHFWRSSTVLQ